MRRHRYWPIESSLGLPKLNHRFFSIVWPITAPSGRQMEKENMEAMLGLKIIAAGDTNQYKEVY
jgi:hypothetical protein